MSTVQNALPTPPGSDSYVSDSQFMLGSHQKSGGPDFPSLVSYASVPSYDYQPAMTPPSSVSPRDKPPYSDPSSSANGGYGDVTSGTSSLGSSVVNSSSFRPPQSSSYLDGPAQPLPLKPQVYGYHHPHHSALESAAAAHHHQYGAPTLADQSQFYPPPHTGFHLYHPGKSTPYGDLKNTNWYSTTS